MKEMNDKNVFRLKDRPKEALFASCVLVACRVMKIGMTERLILGVCICTRKQLCSVLRGVHWINKKTLPAAVPNNSASDLVVRFCSNLSLPQKVVVITSHIIDEIDRRGIYLGRVVASVAAASILMACLATQSVVKCGDRTLIYAVSLVSGAAEATIKDIYKVVNYYPNTLVKMID